MLDADADQRRLTKLIVDGVRSFSSVLPFTAQALLLCLGLDTMCSTPGQTTWMSLWLSQDNAFECNRNRKACPDHIKMTGAILASMIALF